MTHIKAMIALVLAASIVTPAAAFARADVSVDADERNWAPEVEDWEEYGEAEAFEDGRVRIDADGSRSGHLYTDVDVPSRYDDDLALFISFTRAERPYPRLTNGDENIAGLPYLYGYFLDDDGRVESYFTNGYMRYDVNRGRGWQVTYGYMPVPEDTESIRLFLKQANRAGYDADGREAWFYAPGLYFVEDREEARDVVEAYEDALDDVRRRFGDNHPVRYDFGWDDEDEDRADFATGTLLKCSGEADVYSVTSDDTLKRFPNEETFYAWGHSFADVRTVSCSTIDDMRVTGTWTFEREDYLVKFDGQPAVFSLYNGRYLRLIPDEYTARQLFGRNWEDDIREYPLYKMGDFSYGVPHESLN